MARYSKMQRGMLRLLAVMVAAFALAALSLAQFRPALAGNCYPQTRTIYHGCWFVSGCPFDQRGIVREHQICDCYYMGNCYSGWYTTGWQISCDEC